MHPAAADNYYRVKAISSNGRVQYSAVVKLSPLTKDASFSIYPNPVTDGVINLYFDHKAPGNYTINISNSIGQSVHNETVHVVDDHFVQMISINKNTSPGTYLISITDEKGKHITLSFLIR